MHVARFIPTAAYCGALRARAGRRLGRARRERGASQGGAAGAKSHICRVLQLVGDKASYHGPVRLHLVGADDDGGRRSGEEATGAGHVHLRARP